MAPECSVRFRGVSAGGWYLRWDRRVAQLYLASRRAHEMRWQFIDLATGTAMVAFLWLTIGRIAGIAFAILWGLFMLLGLFVLGWKWCLARRNMPNSGSDPLMEM